MYVFFFFFFFFFFSEPLRAIEDTETLKYCCKYIATFFFSSIGGPSTISKYVEIDKPFYVAF